MADRSVRAGMKRPHSAAFLDHDGKRRRVHHSLQHTQSMPAHVEPAPQDPVFIQGQLLRSIATALALAGFDSVKPTALEMFRSHVEEHMLRLATDVRASMEGSRRTRPVPQDLSVALASARSAHTASLLAPQLKLRLPQAVSYPSIDEAEPAPQSTLDHTDLLAPLMSKETPSYIPAHFPRLPPRHAWVSTPVFPEREGDTRKIRERATQEGMLAEQALRRLATAAKTGAIKAAKDKQRTTGALSGPGKLRVRGQKTGRGVRGGVSARMDGKEQRVDSLADLMSEVGGDEESAEDGDATTASDNKAHGGIETGMPEGVVVNSEMGHWRHAGRKGNRM